ncbi:MAG: hypothetical protein IJ399_00890 [Bacilli bacterium]|jgi:uncharacterized protein YukE|nr:hypothetical protein [Bacilli bacterium]
MIDIDFAQVKTLVADFDRAVSSYCTATDSFFNEINSFKGWEGDAADKYLSNVNAESALYITFGDNLKNFVNTLDQAIDSLEATFNSAAK